MDFLLLRGLLMSEGVLLTGDLQFFWHDRSLTASPQ